MFQVIQNISELNQVIRTVVQIDGKSMALNLHIRWNSKIQRWLMTVMDEQKNVIVWNVPLQANESYESSNLLHQLAYKEIGSAWIFQIVNSPSSENPSSDNLGIDKEFALVWGDTVAD